MSDVAGDGQVDAGGSARDALPGKLALEHGQRLQLDLVALEVNRHRTVRGEAWHRARPGANREVGVQVKARLRRGHRRVQAYRRAASGQRRLELDVGRRQPTNRRVPERRAHLSERIAASGRQPVRSVEDGLARELRPFAAQGQLVDRHAVVSSEADAGGPLQVQLLAKVVGRDVEGQTIDRHVGGRRGGGAVRLQPPAQPRPRNGDPDAQVSARGPGRFQVDGVDPRRRRAQHHPARTETQRTRRGGGRLRARVQRQAQHADAHPLHAEPAQVAA
jgi:hypothetical protein